MLLRLCDCTETEEQSSSGARRCTSSSHPIATEPMGQGEMGADAVDPRAAPSRSTPNDPAGTEVAATGHDGHSRGPSRTGHGSHHERNRSQDDRNPRYRNRNRFPSGSTRHWLARHSPYPQPFRKPSCRPRAMPRTTYPLQTCWSSPLA